MFPSPRSSVWIVLLAALAACSPRPKIERETNAVGLARPSMVYVYPFAVAASEVRLDPGGPLARLRERVSGGGDSDQDEQTIALGHTVASRVAGDLVQRIVAMGLPAQQIDRSLDPPTGAVAVAGQFVDVDEGNRVRRMAIGFHQGQSRVAAQVQLYEVTGPSTADQLLDFSAVGESKPVPGAAVTMGAGAAVQVAGAAAGAKELNSSVQSDADRLAEQIANSLQDFFAKQGWTAPPSSLPNL